MTIWQKLSDFSDLTRASAVLGMLRDLGGRLAGAAPGEPQSQVAFTIAVVALSAKMARSDGVVSDTEWRAFQQVVQVPEGQAANVRRVFDLAKGDTAGYEAYANQIARLLASDRRLLQHVLEGLFHVASADAALHPKEDTFLKTVAERFGFTQLEYRHIRSRFVVGDEASPYDVLRLEPTASPDEIKARHRELVSANHPDRLMARGVPPEFVALADRKTAAINEAYAQIRKERGF